MTILTVQPNSTQSESQLWRRIFGTERFLTIAVIVSSFLFIASIILSIFDSQLIIGEPAWIKPMKFAISIVLYTGTLAWMLSFVTGHPRLIRWVGGLTTLGFAVELVAIFFQASQGVRSHFNVSSTLSSTIYSLMGAFVLVIWTMNIIAAILLIRQKMDNRPFAWAIRLALLVTIVGSALGFFMNQPTSDQLIALQAGETVSIIGAHSVGVEDGGPGVPFIGWSTEGGDIRPAHFVGLHALQIIPLLGFFINRRYGKKLSEGRRTALVAIGGLGYLGFTLLLLWQAQRAQSLFAPDGLTLTVLAGLVGVVIIAGYAVQATASQQEKLAA